MVVAVQVTAIVLAVQLNTLYWNHHSQQNQFQANLLFIVAKLKEQLLNFNHGG